MTLINADDIKIKDYSEIVRKDVELYKENIGNFFDLITNMSSSTLEWVGPDADRYIEGVNLEKSQYDDFYNTFISFLDELDNSVSNLTNSITYRE